MSPTSSVPRGSNTHGRNIMWMLNTHRNLPKFCSFLHRNAPVVCMRRCNYFVNCTDVTWNALAINVLNPQNVPNVVWRPGSARTSLGSLGAPQTLYPWPRNGGNKRRGGEKQSEKEGRLSLWTRVRPHVSWWNGGHLTDWHYTIRPTPL